MEPPEDESRVLTLMYVVPPVIGVGFLLLLFGLRFGLDSLVLPLAGIVAGSAVRGAVVLVRAHRAAHDKRRPARVARPHLAWTRRGHPPGSGKGLRGMVAAIKPTVTATHQCARQGYQKLMTWVSDASVSQNLADVLCPPLRTPAGQGGRDGAPARDGGEGS